MVQEPGSGEVRVGSCLGHAISALWRGQSQSRASTRRRDRGDCGQILHVCVEVWSTECDHPGMINSQSESTPSLFFCLLTRAAKGNSQRTGRQATNAGSLTSAECLGELRPFSLKQRGDVKSMETRLSTRAAIWNNKGHQHGMHWFICSYKTMGWVLSLPMYSWAHCPQRQEAAFLQAHRCYRQRMIHVGIWPLGFVASQRM